MSFADITRSRRYRSSRGPDPRLAHVNRKFHPAVAWPTTPQDVILVTGDGWSFYYSLTHLGAYSSFFETLADLPTPAPGAFHHEVPLPSATAAGLEVVLKAINSGEAFPFPSLDRARLAYGILPAIELSHPYEIPLFTEITQTQLLKAFEPYAFLQYALAAALKAEPTAIAASRRTLPLIIDKMPAEATELILERSPSYHPRLQYLHEYARPRLVAFRQAMILNELLLDGPRGFLSSCGGVCPGWKLVKGDWQELRSRIAKALLDSFAGKPGAWNRGSIEVAAKGIAGCAVCGARLANVFERAVAKHGEALSLKDTI